MSASVWAEAARLAANGNRRAAQRLISRSILANPSNAEAWEELARYLDQPDKVQECGRRAQALRRQKAQDGADAAVQSDASQNSDDGPKGTEGTSGANAREDRRQADSADHWLRLCQKVMSDLDLPFDVAKVGIGPRLIGIDLRLRPRSRGVRPVSALRRNRVDIAVALRSSGLTVSPGDDEGSARLLLPRTDAEVVWLAELLKDPIAQAEIRNATLPLVIGRAWDGTPIIQDLASLKHVLIGGSPGTGKTECLRALVAALIQLRSPTQLQLVLLDPRRALTPSFDRTAHCVTPVCEDGARALALLQELNREVDERLRILAKAGVHRLEDLDRLTGPKANVMSRILMVIDDLSDLVRAGPEGIEEQIAHIADLGGAAGVHLLIATETLSPRVLIARGMTAISARIVMRTATEQESHALLGQPGAEELLGEGDLLFRTVGPEALRRGQACQVSEQDVDHLQAAWRGDSKPT